jgi:hypothetical protein
MTRSTTRRSNADTPTRNPFRPRNTGVAAMPRASRHNLPVIAGISLSAGRIGSLPYGVHFLLDDDASKWVMFSSGVERALGTSWTLARSREAEVLGLLVFFVNRPFHWVMERPTLASAQSCVVPSERRSSGSN